MSEHCPNCNAERREDAADCPYCGVVFARLREPGSGRARPAGAGSAGAVSAGERPPGERLPRAVDVEIEPVVRSIDAEGWKALAIGAGLAVLVHAFPFARFVFSYLIVLIHELGHAAVGWLFGYAAVPAFDFRYGGGVTFHGNQHLIIVIAVAAGLGFLLHVFRRNRLTQAVVATLLGLYLLAAFTWLHEAVQIAAGHGMELLLAGVFLFRATKGSGLKVAAERPLYAACGFFVVLQDVIFSYRLWTSRSARIEYGEAKGGGHWMDFSRLSIDYLDLGLPVIAFAFLACTLAVPALVFLAFRHETKLRHLASRLLRLEA